MPINLNNAKEHCCLKYLKWNPLNNAEVDLLACLPVALVGLDGIAVDVISLASLHQNVQWATGKLSWTFDCSVSHLSFRISATVAPPVTLPMHCNGIAQSYHKQSINAHKWAPLSDILEKNWSLFCHIYFSELSLELFVCKFSGWLFTSSEKCFFLQ